jgi:uncharacterized protein (TIGR03437 family)
MRLFLLLASVPVLAAGTAVPDAPLSFERGLRQATPRFFARAGGHAVRLSAEGISLQSERGSLQLRFANANPAPALEPLDPLPGTSNYLLGRDPSRWITGVPAYARVRYRQLYPGIDLICHGSTARFEYDFEISPGADPARIRVTFGQTYAARIDRHGDLALSDGDREWRQPAPHIYQGLHSVAGRYVLRPHGEFGFEIGAYDRGRALVIDPVVIQATYFGGTHFDMVTGMTVDAAGNIYLTGFTNSADFPVTADAYDTQQIGGPCPVEISPYSTANAWCYDVFVTKLNPSGTALIYSTYVGGTGNDEAAGIAVDGQGNAYVTGWTDSTDFPVTAGALQMASEGGNLGQDAFLFQLDPSGAKLLSSTYIGGTQDDQATAIAISPAGDLYVTGTTFSSDFPVRSALQAQQGGGDCSSFFFTNNETACGDAFLVHWRLPAMTLVYSTYLGGSSNDSASAVALDAAGSVYLTGTTISADFPLSHPLQPLPGGGPCLDVLYGQAEPACSDAFVTKINAAGSAFVYSTYLGGAGNNSGVSIAVDAQGDAYVAGTTFSGSFPLVNATQSQPGGGICAAQLSFAAAKPTVSCSDAFVAKISPQGSSLVYSTYLGGVGDDSATAIAVDANGDAFVAGGASSIGFPITPDALTQCNGAGSASFLTELGPNGSLAYSTYFPQAITVLALGGTGYLYTAGQPAYFDGGPLLLGLPTTPQTVQTTFGSTNDYIAMLDLTAAPPPGPAIDAGCVVNAAGYQSTWSYGSGSIAPGEIAAIFGQGLGPAAGASATVDADGYLPTEVAGVSVTFNGTLAPLLYVSANQVNAIVPFEVAGSGEALIQLQYQGESSPVAQMSVANAVPGIFTYGAKGSGQAAALNQDGSFNSPSNPAARGSIVSIWASGLGVMSPPYQDGQIAQGTPSQLALPPGLYVTNTGTPLSLEYAGQAPGFVAGAVQINFTIPTYAQTGPAVQVSFGEFYPQSATIAIK